MTLNDNGLYIPKTNGIIKPNLSDKVINNLVNEPKPLEDWEVQEVMELTEILDGPVGIPAVIIIYGKPRSGKTLFAVWLCWKLKKYFGMRTVVDSPFLTTAYGDWHYMSDKEFMKERAKINKTIELYERMGVINQLDWKDLNIWLYQAGVIWDETEDKISVHQTADKVAREYNNATLQYGHNECAFCIVSHDPKQINRQYAGQFHTHEVSCTYHKNYRGSGEAWSTYMIYNKTSKKFYPKSLKVETWGQLFKSRGIISSKVTMGKLKTMDLDERDRLEVDTFIEREKAKLIARGAKDEFC